MKPFKSSRHEMLALVEPADTQPWVKPSPQGWAACKTGPCNRGRKPCPSPEACRLAERAQRQASGSLRQVGWLAAIAIAMVVGVAILWRAVR